MQFIKTKMFFLLGVISSFNGLAQDIQFISTVFEYKPAPGQFVNTLFGFPAASQSIIGEMQGGVSLGAFGGYIVTGFEKPIENDPNNPYGIDFTIFGNANQSSSEPAVVYVMRDENNNGLPDDTWFLLAGSDYWFESTLRNYEITYFNPDSSLTKDIVWEDNQGNTGSIPSNEFHTQSYYPFNDSFPDIPIDKYVLNGAKISDRLDQLMLDYITAKPMPFGYADNLPRNNNYSGWEPDNPYTNEIEGSGGDAFDINWAIDEDGNYIELSQIDFIKIQTGVNAMAGWLGEISTEVLGVVDVEPDSTLVGENKLLIIEPKSATIDVGKRVEFKSFTFINGQIKYGESIKWTSSDNEVAIVDEFGVIEALNEGYFYIKAQWEQYPEIYDSLKIKVNLSNGVSTNWLNDFNVYPNPIIDILFLSENHDFTHYTILNNCSKVLIHSEITSNILYLGNLHSGFYYIEFKGNGVGVCKKIIKI